MIGSKFGKLTVIEKIDKVMYRCICDCGKEKIARKYNLLRLTTRSCGCLIAESKKKHGLRYTPLYGLWGNMRQRCNNVKYRDFHNYGGRGIKVCKEWDSFENFYTWALDNGFQKGLTLDRIDNNCGYSPFNCRWVDQKIQNNNKRSNVRTDINGSSMTLMEISEVYSLAYSTVSSRFKQGLRGSDLITQIKSKRVV